jgi:hypothetical protein
MEKQMPLRASLIPTRHEEEALEPGQRVVHEIVNNGYRAATITVMMIVAQHWPSVDLRLTDGEERELDTILDGDVVALLQRLGHQPRGQTPCLLPRELAVVGVVVWDPMMGQARAARELRMVNASGSAEISIRRRDRIYTTRIRWPHGSIAEAGELVPALVAAGLQFRTRVSENRITTDSSGLRTRPMDMEHQVNGAAIQ